MNKAPGGEVSITPGTGQTPVAIWAWRSIEGEVPGASWGLYPELKAYSSDSS